MLFPSHNVVSNIRMTRLRRFACRLCSFVVQMLLEWVAKQFTVTNKKEQLESCSFRITISFQILE